MALALRRPKGRLSAAGGAAASAEARLLPAPRTTGGILRTEAGDGLVYAHRACRPSRHEAAPAGE